MSTVTPLNWNLDSITLPPDASSALVVDEIWGDSQMGMNSIRLAGSWPIANLPFVGRLLGFNNTASTGVSVTLASAADVSVQNGGSALVVGDAWASDGNTTDHFSYSAGWTTTSAGSVSRQLLVITVSESTLYTGSFPLANQRLNARVFYRKNANNLANIRVYPHRNGSRGGYSTIALDNTGGIGYFDRTINAANPASGAEPAGIEIWTDASFGSGEGLELLGVLLYRSDTGSTMVSTGYVHCPIYRSGYDASELAAGVSDTAINALHLALNDARGGTASVDLVQFETGHNNDTNGYTTGIETLRTKVANSLSGGGYDTPDYLMWAMWSYDGNQSRMSTQADDLFAYCRTNGYGFINLFKTYNGDDPETNGARFDGTPATYTMDASNLHPSDSSTADLIVQDIEEHWQPGNWVTVLTTTGGLRSRDGRSRQR